MSDGIVRIDGLTVAFATLGCKVNSYETEAVAALFKEQGYSVVDFSSEADVYIINTCSVTNMGARKSRQIVRRAIRRNPDAVVAVMGCYTQVAPGEMLDIPGVDIVLGTNRRAELVDLVNKAIESETPINIVDKIGSVKEFEEIAAMFTEGRTRAIVKVQDGCNESCAYCQIPRARGRSRSRRIDKVLLQVEELAENGFKEIVLTGVHLGIYGADLPGEVNLAKLVGEVARIPGVMRLRLSSVDPNEFSEELISAIVDNKNVCRHLHIPAQSGENGVLDAMRRRHTTEEFLGLARSLRKALPDLAITTDVITGFPGESEESFSQTLSFCEEVAFSKIHVFPFSMRKGTLAAGMPNQISAQVKQERARKLISLSDKMALEFHNSLLGSRLEVLLEGPSDEYEGHIQGLASNYVRVHVPQSQGVSPGNFIFVQAMEASPGGILGKLEGRRAAASKKDQHAAGVARSNSEA